jgi:hypothetical protein
LDNNDDERFRSPIFLLKIATSTRKIFSENYQQFGHAFSNMVASPALEEAELTMTIDQRVKLVILIAYVLIST